MTKFLALICLLFFMMSCNPPAQDCGSTVSKAQDPSASSPATANCSPDDSDTTPVDSKPAPPSGPVPSEALTFKVNVTMLNFEDADKVKVNKAIDIIKKVVASQEFKDRVYAFSYNGKKGFIDNNGMTNEQIYQTILEGKEGLLPVIDNEMDLELQLYYSAWTSTVGYTTPDENRIYMNTKFFAGYSPLEVADNIFHEWTHKLGFDHDVNYSESRDYSVPYGLGYLIEELGAKYK